LLWQSKGNLSEKAPKNSDQNVWETFQASREERQDIVAIVIKTTELPTWGMEKGQCQERQVSDAIMIHTSGIIEGYHGYMSGFGASNMQ
jgi:hypothetical protein